MRGKGEGVGRLGEGEGVSYWLCGNPGTRKNVSSKNLSL